jgi:hypothetical protein
MILLAVALIGSYGWYNAWRWRRGYEARGRLLQAEIDAHRVDRERADEEQRILLDIVAGKRER